MLENWEEKLKTIVLVIQVEMKHALSMDEENKIS